jgi:hypothetical protein
MKEPKTGSSRQVTTKFWLDLPRQTRLSLEAFTFNEWLATREAMQQEEPELRLALKQNDRKWTSEE